MLNFDCGIYAITSPSGKQYIGSARSFQERWRKHIKDLREGVHHSAALQNAYRKYGEFALKFEKIAIVPKQDLLWREQEQIDTRPRGQLYNVALVAGSALGVKRSAATKARVAEAKRKQTSETRAKISAALKGRKLAPEQVEQMRQRMQGQKHSEAAKAKMSAARKGREHSDAHAAAIGAALRGRKHSPERVAAMLAGKAGKLQANNTSGFVGVYAHKGRWRARVRSAGRLHGLGTFDMPEAANAAIIAFKAKLDQDQ